LFILERLTIEGLPLVAVFFLKDVWTEMLVEIFAIVFPYIKLKLNQPVYIHIELYPNHHLKVYLCIPLAFDHILL